MRLLASSLPGTAALHGLAFAAAEVAWHSPLLQGFSS
jgi:hypothetical protein